MTPGDSNGEGGEARPFRAESITTTLIRPLKQTDIPTLDIIISTLASAHSGYWPPFSLYSKSGTPAQWLADQPTSTRLVAELNRQVVGHVGVRPATDHQLVQMISQVCDPASANEVVKLFVAPSARRHGVATALLDAAVELIRQQSMIPVLGCFDEPTPSAATSLYLSLGWQPIGSGIGNESGLPFTAFWLPPKHTSPMLKEADEPAETSHPNKALEKRLSNHPPDSKIIELGGS